jgi:hypothetical protein
MDKKIYVVTWTNHTVGQVGPEDIKCFETREIAITFAKLMSNEYNYVNTFEDYASNWD